MKLLKIYNITEYKITKKIRYMRIIKNVYSDGVKTIQVTCRKWWLFNLLFA